ncbi:hypothetical protein G6F55_014263 [Rhizopus delemar]|nr:hypothetical protein G6F55_014263 [Rhizopus delemar]
MLSAAAPRAKRSTPALSVVKVARCTGERETSTRRPVMTSIRSSRALVSLANGHSELSTLRSSPASGSARNAATGSTTRPLTRPGSSGRAR